MTTNNNRNPIKKFTCVNDKAIQKAIKDITLINIFSVPREFTKHKKYNPIV